MDNLKKKSVNYGISSKKKQQQYYNAVPRSKFARISAVYLS